MNVGQEWKKALEKEGYEYRLNENDSCQKLKRFSRIWKRVFRVARINASRLEDFSVFEFGCGGGKHLVPFALNGFRCVGIDVSPEVLGRAGQYIKEVSGLCGAELSIKLIYGDFLEYQAPGSLFDLVFHVGVIEHFLDDNERQRALQKMFALAKPGGYVVSMVPSGMHPIRQKMKKLGLGGYGIAEIDYTPEIMAREFKACGSADYMALPHNVFGYLLIDDARGLVKLGQKLLYYVVQIIPPRFLPYQFAVRHASALIGIAKKPLL